MVSGLVVAMAAWLGRAACDDGSGAVPRRSGPAAVERGRRGDVARGDGRDIGGGSEAAPTGGAAAGRPRVRSGSAVRDAEEIAEIAPPHEFAMRFVSVGGKPLAGATVTRLTGRGPVVLGVTDGNGLLRAAAADAAIVVSRDGFVSAEFYVEPPDDARDEPDADGARRVDVALHRAVVVRGVVVRPNDEPCEGLALRIASGPRGPRVAESAQTVSGTNGEFEFPALAVAAFDAEDSARWIVLPDDDIHTGERPDVHRPRIAAPEPIPLDQDAPYVRVVRPWRADVVGQCVRDGGAPIPVADGATETARFRLKSVTSPGQATVTQIVGSEEWEAEVSWDGAGPEIDLGAVVFRPPHRVGGVVTDPSGDPVPETGVSILGGTGGQTARLTVYTDEAGRFELPRGLRDGEFLLVRAFLPGPVAADGAEGDSVRAWTVVERETIDNSGRADIRVVASPNPVARLRLVDAAGRAVPTKSAERTDQPRLSPREIEVDGFMTLALVGPPPWEIRVANGQCSRSVVIRAGEPLTRDVVIDN